MASNSLAAKRGVKNKTKNKVLLLVKIRIAGIFAGVKKSLKGERRDKIKLIAFSLLMLYSFGVMIYTIGSFTKAFVEVGFADVVLPMMATSGAMLMLISTVFRGGNSLFAPKDYDFVSSLPLSDSEIVISRLITQYIYEFFFVIIVFLPAVSVYAYLVSPPLIFWILIIPTILLLPCIPAFIGSLAAVIITFIASRFRHKNLGTIIIGLLFVFGAMYFSSMMGTYANSEKIAEMGEFLSAKLKYVYFPAHLLGRGLTGEILPWLAYFAISVVCVAILIFFLNKNHRKMYAYITSIKTKAGRRPVSKRTTASLSSAKTAAANVRRTSPTMALYKKEFRRYFSCPTYVLNTIIGPIMVLLIGGAVSFVPMEKIFGVSDPFFDWMIVKILPIAFVFAIMLSSTTSSSISLEGSERYNILSAPLTNAQIYRSKILVNLTLLLPAVLISWVLMLIFGSELGFGVYDIILTLVVPVSFSVFVSCFGLYVNLKHQKFDWKTEVEVVKQSVATMITTFTGMGISMSMILIFFLISQYGDMWLFVEQMAFSALVLILSYICWRASLKIKIEG